MTNKEALQSLIEYENDLLFDKVLIDNSIDGSLTYSASNEGVIELCSAYIYKSLLSHPDFAEGKLRIKYDRESLINLINGIFKKNGKESEMIISEAEIKFITL